MKKAQKELTALGWKDVSAAHLIGLTTQLNSAYKHSDQKNTSLPHTKTSRAQDNTGVVDVDPRHGPHPNLEFSRCGDSGFPQPAAVCYRRQVKRRSLGAGGSLA
jgi:hypothetical protein